MVGVNSKAVPVRVSGSTQDRAQVKLDACGLAFRFHPHETTVGVKILAYE